MNRRQFLNRTTISVVGAGALAAPALSNNRTELTVVSSWPRDFPGLGTSAQRLVERINELGDGRIDAQYYAASECVGGFDVFDDVASGNSQAYVSADYYWVGKHPAFAYFCTVPFGMVRPEWNAWYKYRGGAELWDKLSGDFGVKSLPCGATVAQAGGWFKRDIESVEDLKGLRMRIPGLGGRVM